MNPRPIRGHFLNRFNPCFFIEVDPHKYSDNPKEFLQTFLMCACPQKAIETNSTSIRTIFKELAYFVTPFRIQSEQI